MKVDYVISIRPLAYAGGRYFWPVQSVAVSLKARRLASLGVSK